MDEIWEKAVETALDGQKDHESVRSLTLDGAVKCVHGRLPHPSVFERFPNLQHLSLANIGVSSLEQFSRLVNLQKLVLSDNRIAGGLECLVEAGLGSLVDLDLSNNKIQYIEDLVPLAKLRLVSLDLYECPVTRVKDYRARVFGLIKSLKYLDKMDAEENETPESDEEEDEEDEEEDDPGSGEVDGGDRPIRTENGHGSVDADGILDGEEDEESDADEEDNEILANGEYVQHEANAFRMLKADENGDDVNDDEIEEDGNSSGEEIDEEDAEEDEVVEAHDVVDSDDEDDGVEYEEEGEDDSDEDDNDDEEEEEVDNKEQGTRLGSSTVRFASVEGEIDGHEQGEDDSDEDDNGETGEDDEQGMEEEEGGFEEDAEEEDEDDENGSGFLVQPVNQHAIANDDELSGGSDMEPVNDIHDEEEDEDIFDDEDVEDDLENNQQVPQVPMPPSSSSLHSKRNRSDHDADSEDSGEEDDMVRQAKLPKKDP